MADDVKTLVGIWEIRFRHYFWVYTFNENGTVKWLDPNNGKNGSGRWMMSPSGVTINWTGSKTVELWALPINASTQSGTIKGDWAEGPFTASKRSTNFEAFAPEGQSDPYACWAACLAWFTKVIPDVPTQSQSSFLSTAQPGQYTREGMITIDGMFNLSVPAFTNRARATAGEIRALLEAGRFPLMIGYQNGPLGGHMNVIYGYTSANNGTVKVMDPWSPDPDKNKTYAPMYDGNMLLGYFKKTGNRDAFRFTGSYQTRPFAYYQAKPFAGDKFFIMYQSR